MPQRKSLASLSSITRRCFKKKFRSNTNTRGLLLVVLVALTTVPVVESAEKLSQAEKAKLASEVKTVFENKCAKCHGPKGIRETEKPKGELDYILDLAKLASSLKLIVPGNPGDSKLYNMVADLIMPDDTAGEEPLPDNEIQLIGRWIEAGAPTENGTAAALKVHCPATKKFDFKTVYSPEQLQERQFSTRLEELPEGIFLDRCNFSASAGKVVCNRQKVDRVEFDQKLHTKKFYIFNPQVNFQLFSDLNSITDDGVGSVQYGKCEFISP